jgi:Asp-tRNA(Asn)/Glu-tRNA(Gln) amidotransferase B subunit
MSGNIKCEAQNVNSTKKSRKAISLETRREILGHHESGMKVNELAFMFEMSQSTLSTILKDKEKYLREVKSASPI